MRHGRAAWRVAALLACLMAAAGSLAAQDEDAGQYMDPDEERYRIYAEMDALRMAAAEGDLQTVRSMLPAPAYILDGDLFPPLVEAARNGHREIVALLLEAGAAIDRQDGGGATALMAAAEAGKADVVRLLLDKGADRALKDERGRTAEALARAAAHTAIAELLRAAPR